MWERGEKEAYKKQREKKGSEIDVWPNEERWLGSNGVGEGG